MRVSAAASRRLAAAIPLPLSLPVSRSPAGTRAMTDVGRTVVIQGPDETTGLSPSERTQTALRCPGGFCRGAPHWRATSFSKLPTRQYRAPRSLPPYLRAAIVFHRSVRLSRHRRPRSFVPRRVSGSAEVRLVARGLAGSRRRAARHPDVAPRDTRLLRDRDWSNRLS